MGVGVDRNPDTGLAREPGVAVAEVEPVGLGVDLERRPGRRCPLDDAIDVDGRALEPGATAEPTPGEMADAVDVGVLDRGEDPLGGASIERGVQRGDDPVELRQYLVRHVDLAVGADVRLDAAQDPEGAALASPARRSSTAAISSHCASSRPSRR